MLGASLMDLRKEGTGYVVSLDGDDLDLLETALRRGLNTWENVPKPLSSLYYSVIAANALRKSGQLE